MSDVRLLRRSFLSALGLGAGGLALGVFASSARDANAAPTKPGAKPEGLSTPGANAGFRPNAFVHVAASGAVTIMSARSEMGQGVRSSLPVLIADELGADMAKVVIVQADGDAKYGDQDTDGSTSVRNLYDDMRRAGAIARTLLVGAAAKKWSVPPSECEARDHAVWHAKTKRTLGFGELADLATKLPVPKATDVTLRPTSELKRVGGPLPNVDAPDVVTGKAIFGADVKIAGMLTAVVLRPPVVGGKVARYDAKRALAIPGVKKIVELPVPKGAPHFQPCGGLAVVATDTWSAMRGRAALEVTWDHGANVVYDSDDFKQKLGAAVRAPGEVVRKVGDVDRALASAAKRVEAEYHLPHLAHVPMEPPVAIARIGEDGACECWAPSQEPQSARTEVAKALGIDEKQVTMHVTLLGGGFGRKSKPDYVVEAALVAKAAGAPVRVQWTREDDIAHDYFHTTSAQRLTAGLDAKGKVVAWLHRTAFPSISSTFKEGVTHSGPGELQQGVLDVPLAVPNVRAENGAAIAHVRIGWLRSVANVYHAFAVQSFMDEIAHARGEDTKDVMLELYGAPRVWSAADLGVEKVPNYGHPLDKHAIDTGRMRGVIERVTAMSGWADRKKTGRALGLAAHRSFVTYVACVVSVVQGARGKIKIDEAWIACDAGTVINPDRARAQMEGAVIFGTSIALHGAITMKNGVPEQSNFRDYKIARIGDAPKKIHVDILKSDGAPGGIGEPGVPAVAPAIANAVFALTGKRVRDLPLSAAGLA